jgi:hypothetical protein
VELWVSPSSLSWWRNAGQGVVDRLNSTTRQSRAAIQWPAKEPSYRHAEKIRRDLFKSQVRASMETRRATVDAQSMSGPGPFTSRCLTRPRTASVHSTQTASATSWGERLRCARTIKLRRPFSAKARNNRFGRDTNRHTTQPECARVAE